jgi:RHS repeat-associated protein
MLHRFTLFAALLGLGLSARAAEPDYSQYEIKTWSTATYDVMVGGLLESSQTDALGNTVKSRSDAAGRTRISIDADGNSSTAFFDANGNLVQSRDALNHGQNCAYDALNRRTSCSDTQELAEGKSLSTTYNASGAVATQVDTKGAVTANSYDLRDRLVSITERNSGVVSFAYDAKGQRTSVTDQLGKVTSYQFNPRGELIKTINADASLDETVFDALGRKIKVIHPGGNSAVMAYDLASRLLSRNYFAAGSGIAESTDSFTYDLASRPVTANNADALISYTYDSIGRRSSLTQTVDGLAKTITFVYDAANRLLSRSPEGLAVETRSFTNRGQLASVSLGNQEIAAFGYDAAGRETSRTYGNGLQTTSSYSRADNLITAITVANKPELSFNYSYDSNKNVTAEQRGGSMALYSWNATFDAMDRLNSQNDGVQTRSWTLDTVGNTTSETLNGTAEARTLNAMHAPIAAGNKAYTYDSNGQMTSKPGYTLVWDARNHLVLSTGLAGILPGPAAAAPVTYRYDAFGNRVSKGNTRYFLVDNEVVGELTNGSFKQYCYAYIDEVLAEQVVTPSLTTPSLPSYHHRNLQYNTVALTDANGAIIEQYSTDAMGRVKSFDAAGSPTSPSSRATNVLFTGRVFDAETGFYYFRARYFDPELGVFISRDPLGFADGNSIYQGWFALLYGIDPTGESLLDLSDFADDNLFTGNGGNTSKPKTPEEKAEEARVCKCNDLARQYRILNATLNNACADRSKTLDKIDAYLAKRKIQRDAFYKRLRELLGLRRLTLEQEAEKAQLQKLHKKFVRDENKRLKKELFDREATQRRVIDDVLRKIQKVIEEQKKNKCLSPEEIDALDEYWKKKNAELEEQDQRAADLAYQAGYPIPDATDEPGGLGPRPRPNIPEVPTDIPSNQDQIDLDNTIIL